jgi:hypothetical protein
MSNTAGNAGPKPSPMLKAASLWSKTSVKGGWYLTGRLGGVKVLILENRERQSDDDPSHHLFFVEAPDRRQGATERSGATEHRRRARGHHSLSAAARRAMGSVFPIIRRRSTATRRPGMQTSMMCRSGRDEDGVSGQRA